MKVEYTLTLNSEQAREINKAVDLLMRLKINQYKELPFALVSIEDNEFCNKRDAANPYLKLAFDAMYQGKKDTEWKDDEWYRLYNIHQVIRKAIHDAEHPEGKGIDGDPPMAFGGQPLPKIRWEKK